MGHEGNLAPRVAASVISSFESGDKPALAKAFATLMRIHAIHYRSGGPVRAMKPLLNAYGLPGGAVRLPRAAIDADELKRVIDETARLEIAELPPLRR
jgi:dihydrodipicolinate synthase/N-acetylneuraminate lyase